MGLFDQMFGREATKAQQLPDAQQQFNVLKLRYQAALRAVEQEGVRLQNLHVQDGKLVLRGVAPSEAAKNKVWDAIKGINPQPHDILADISVAPGQGGPAGAAVAPPASAKTYTVKAGDTLSKISKAQYGDANEYMRIFYANQDRLKDPDKIQVGQVLSIPPDDNA
jgi:nucleoid-associated protein YgaU